jgi:hypothetical protein
MADPELGDLREREQLCRKRDVDVAGRESALEASWQATEQTKAEGRQEYRDPNIIAGRIGRLDGAPRHHDQRSRG